MLFKRYAPIVWKRCSSYRWRQEANWKTMQYLRFLAARKKMKLTQIKQRRERRWWVRPLLQHHDTKGAWCSTIPIMRSEDPEMFYETFRMTPDAFDRLLALVEPYISKKSCRKPIPPGERLAITLRYLVTGQSFSQLMQYFLVGEQTISNIVNETTVVIWNVLKPIVFEQLTQETWLRVAAEFESMWNLPHCIGGVDGKHVRVQQPPRSGSSCFNYKSFFSLILMVVSDAKSKILIADVGSSGRRGDGNVFHRSLLAHKMKQGTLNIPPPCPIADMALEASPTPFFFVGDSAFARSENMLTPFKGKFLPPEEKVFNYRLSRARKNVENTFGIMRKRHEVLDKPIQTSRTCAKSIMLALCALHNFHLMDVESVPPMRKRELRGVYYDHVREDGKVVYGRYSHEDPVKERKILNRLRAEVAVCEDCNTKIPTPSSADIVEGFVSYFVQKPLPWQWRSTFLM